MSDLVLRNLDDRLVGDLKARAEALGTTLDATVETLLRSALSGDEAEAGHGPSDIVEIVGRSHVADSTHLVRRDRDGVSENELSAPEAVRRIREIRARSLRSDLPDSTPSIRADRDA